MNGPREIACREDLEAPAVVAATAFHVVVVTGAGISAESGIPTFRDALDGLWANHDPTELATPEAFERNPEKVAAWYQHRMTMCSSVRPNDGHHALARWQALAENNGGEFTLLTQNIDGLHQLAGTHDTVEMHGTLWTWRCTTCGLELNLQRDEPDAWVTTCGCGGRLRPGVVWFGEVLPAAAVGAAESALARCDMLVSIGTSGGVYPVAGFAEHAAAAGIPVLEVNTESTPLSSLATWSLQGPAGHILPGLVQRIVESDRIE